MWYSFFAYLTVHEEKFSKKMRKEKSMSYSYSVSTGAVGGMGFSMIFCLIVSIVAIVSLWKVFAKAGKPGWAAIVPIYNLYTLFDVVYGKGIKFLWLLVPVANMVFMIVVYYKLVKAFGKSGGFGVGLIFLPIVFLPILAFSDSAYAGPQ